MERRGEVVVMHLIHYRASLCITTTSSLGEMWLERVLGRRTRPMISIRVRCGSGPSCTSPESAKTTLWSHKTRQVH